MRTYKDVRLRFLRSGGLQTACAIIRPDAALRVRNALRCCEAEGLAAPLPFGGALRCRLVMR
ncbi:hypothetical protein JCM19000A_16810 [Silvimonas sp. JCM 19000]